MYHRLRFLLADDAFVNRYVGVGYLVEVETNLVSTEYHRPTTLYRHGQLGSAQALRIPLYLVHFPFCGRSDLSWITLDRLGHYHN